MHYVEDVMYLPKGKEIYCDGRKIMCGYTVVIFLVSVVSKEPL